MTGWSELGSSCHFTDEKSQMLMKPPATFTYTGSHIVYKTYLYIYMCVCVDHTISCPIIITASYGNDSFTHDLLNNGGFQ